MASGSQQGRLVDDHVHADDRGDGGDRQRDGGDDGEPLGRDGHLGVGPGPVELGDPHEEVSWLWLMWVTRWYWSSRSFISLMPFRGANGDQLDRPAEDLAALGGHGADGQELVPGGEEWGQELLRLLLVDRGHDPLFEQTHLPGQLGDQGLLLADDASRPARTSARRGRSVAAGRSPSGRSPVGSPASRPPAAPPD